MALAQLVQAVQDNDVVAVQQVLREGADVNGQLNGATPLLHAVDYYEPGSDAVIRHLLGAHADVNAAINSQVPLVKAIRTGLFPEWTGLIRLLLAAGANPNQPTAAGTPLAAAVRDNPCLTLIDALLQSGASVIDSPELPGAPWRRSTMTPDERAAAAAALVSGEADRNPAVLFVRDGNANEAADDGETVLMAAVKRDGGTVASDIDTLVLRGARMDDRGTSGHTALMAAVRVEDARDDRAAQRLLRHGANPNVRTPTGTTALMMAVESWRPDSPFVALLVAHGADVAAADAEGRTAVSFAAHDVRLLADLVAGGAPVPAAFRSADTVVTLDTALDTASMPFPLLVDAVNAIWQPTAFRRLAACEARRDRKAYLAQVDMCIARAATLVPDEAGRVYKSGVRFLARALPSNPAPGVRWMVRELQERGVLDDALTRAESFSVVPVTQAARNFQALTHASVVVDRHAFADAIAARFPAVASDLRATITAMCAGGDWLDGEELGSGGFGVASTACASGVRTDDCRLVLKRSDRAEPNEDASESRDMMREFLIQHVVHAETGLAPQPYMLVARDEEAGMIMQRIVPRGLDSDDDEDGFDAEERRMREARRAEQRIRETSRVSHNDVAPRNCVEDSDGKVWMIDFGVSTVRRSIRATWTMCVCGDAVLAFIDDSGAGAGAGAGASGAAAESKSEPREPSEQSEPREPSEPSKPSEPSEPSKPARLFPGGAAAKASAYFMSYRMPNGDYRWLRQQRVS